MLPNLMLMLAQDTPGPPGDDAAPVVVPRTVLTQRDCIRPSDDEIVVCGREAQSDRYPRLDEPGMPPRATFGISPNKRITVRTEASGNSMLQAPRLMVDFTILF